jgi:DNA-binding XRE family transcriptional regulator
MRKTIPSHFIRKNRKVRATRTRIVGRAVDVESARALARYRDISLEATAFRLRAVRMALGVTQKDMAEALELPTSTYADYERARVYPSHAAVSSFRWHYDITFDFILYGDPRHLPLETAERICNAMLQLDARADQPARG